LFALLADPFEGSGLRAQDAEQIAQLSQLNRSGMRAEAFAFANQLLPIWEGEPAFDLEYVSQQWIPDFLVKEFLL